jgi:hypothetical protein
MRYRQDPHITLSSLRRGCAENKGGHRQQADTVRSGEGLSGDRAGRHF